MLFALSFSLAQEPTYIHFQPEIDIPFSTTYGDIIQDSLGYIWFGTDSGLYRYDGDVFEKIPQSHNIKNIEVLELKKAPNGTLWYRTLEGQLCYYSGQTDSTQVFNPEGIFDSLMVQTFKIQNNRIYAEFKQSKQAKFSIHEFKTEVDNVDEISHLYSWKTSFKFVFHKGNFIVPKNRNRRIESISPLAVPITYCKQLKNDRFIYNKYESILHYNNNLINFFSEQSITTKSFFNVYPIRINGWYIHEHNIFFLTNKGCFKFDTLQNSISLPILQNTNIHSTLIDKEGGQWYGTNGHGLFYFPPQNIHSYESHPKLSTAKIQRIKKIKNGPFAIAAKNTIFFLDANTLKPISHQLDFPEKVYDLFIEHNKIYVQTARQLWVYSFNPEHFQTAKLVKKRQLDGQHIQPINDNQYLIGGYSFLKLYFKNNLVSQKTDQRVTAFFKDTLTSSVWVGGLTGVSIVNYKNTTLEPVPLSFKGLRPHIMMIDKDANNHIWISTTSKGLFEYSNDTTSQYLLKNNRKINRIEQISCTQPSKVWLSSYNKLFFFDKKSKTFKSNHNISAIIKSPITALWAKGDTIVIGTKNGLFNYFPNAFAKHVKLRTEIESVKVNYKDTTIQKNYNLSFLQSNIQIRFKTIGSFNPLKRPYIYYKLDNESDWHLASNNQLSLTNLSPGNYQIIAKSVYNRNQTGFQSIGIQFSILKPFWKTIWFNALAILVSTIIAFLWFNYKRKQIIIKKTREQESEKLKNAVLQLQMNPHFIFNSMNTIIYYITVANKEKSIQILTKLSRLIRQIFVFSNKKVIPLSTEIQFLSDYLDMEQERFSEKVKITKSIEQSLIESNLPIPPLMVQPIIENSFKHGLFHKKGNGILRFSISQIKNGVCFIIEDDGVGRSFSHKPITPNKKIGSYDVINNRIMLINQSTEEFSDIFVHFDVLDLVDDLGKPIGTRSTITFEKIKNR